MLKTEKMYIDNVRLYSAFKCYIHSTIYLDDEKKIEEMLIASSQNNDSVKESIASLWWTLARKGTALLYNTLGDKVFDPDLIYELESQQYNKDKLLNPSPARQMVHEYIFSREVFIAVPEGVEEKKSINYQDIFLTTNSDYFLTGHLQKVESVHDISDRVWLFPKKDWKCLDPERVYKYETGHYDDFISGHRFYKGMRYLPSGEAV